MHNPGLNVARIVGLGVVGVVVAVVFAFLFGYLVMVLWNWLLPPLFHVGTITYWKAFGLVILAKLLFGGFSPHSHGHDRHDWTWKGHDAWAPKGSYRNWKYYDRYWREEGKSAFENWIDRIEREKQGAEQDTKQD